MKAERNRKIIYWLLPLAGILFCLWYVKSATCDVVYSDYIRLVNSYLPDVWNPEKFFVPDVLTRIPINYLCRIVNVELFGFTITLERVLGVVSLGLAGWVFAAYCRSRKIGCLWFALLMAVMFSLNKWEMLTNGPGPGVGRRGKKTGPVKAAGTAVAYYTGYCRPVLCGLCRHAAAFLWVLHGDGP